MPVLHLSAGFYLWNLLNGQVAPAIPIDSPNSVTIVYWTPRFGKQLYTQPKERVCLGSATQASLEEGTEINPF